ncbi:glycosyltransferase family 4 protein [Pseudanabaena sp. BC1403]|uniref:glycosyltransferase family 4 protein n=1 Tax=Pseudanabaena sp. BC1403 TaxID=2043171 RepID=UPI000CD8B878
MKVLHLNTYDIVGGAARAAYRLHKGLQGIGVQSKMLVQTKVSDDYSVIAPTFWLDKIVNKFRPSLAKLTLDNTQQLFSPQWLPDNIMPKIKQNQPDIVNLNWVCDGYFQIETLAKIPQPKIWTLMDMWAFTGGCHYSNTCDRYINSCGACPQLHSYKDQDLSSWVWKRKVNAWRNINITIVSPSNWLAKCAKSSSIFQDTRIEVIPFGLDINRYKPIPQKIARDILHLSQHKLIVLFGAIQATNDLRKGFQLLKIALQHLRQFGYQDKIELAIFGASQPDPPVDLGFRTHYLGQLHDDITLQIIYSAANVMIVPSLQEAFGQTASESLACGTPVVAFDGNGLSDIINHQQNGYLAKPLDTYDLAKGINWVLEDSDRLQRLSYRAREKAEQEFSQELQAKRYLSLFEEIMSSHSSKS